MRMIVKKISLGLILVTVGAMVHSASAQTRAPLFEEAVSQKEYQKADCAGANAPKGALPLYKICDRPKMLLKAALKNAKKADVPLLVVWGFDECAICRRLESTLTGGAGQTPFSSSLFSYALSVDQQNAMPSKGTTQRVMLLRLNVNTPQAGVLARAQGLNAYAAKMGRDKLWSPMMTFYHPKTKKWVSRSAYSGFEKPCRLGDEIVLALEDLGYVPKDPSKTVRMCTSV